MIFVAWLLWVVRRFCSILEFCILGMKRRALSRSTPPCAPSSTYPRTWPGSCPFGGVRLMYRVLFQDRVRKFWRMNFAGLQSSRLASKGLWPKPVFFLGLFFVDWVYMLEFGVRSFFDTEQRHRRETGAWGRASGCRYSHARLSWSLPNPWSPNGRGTKYATLY